MNIEDLRKAPILITVHLLQFQNIISATTVLLNADILLLPVEKIHQKRDSLLGKQKRLSSSKMMTFPLGIVFSLISVRPK